MISNIRFKFRTRDEKEIPVYEGIPVPDNLLHAINNRFRKKYGKNSERRKSDYNYNCHGMTFIGKLGWVGCLPPKEPVTIIIPGMHQIKEYQNNEKDIIEEMLLGNGLCRIVRLDNFDIVPLSGNENVKIGDIIVYKDIRINKEEIQHTAIVVEIHKVNKKICNLKVLSKMGTGGEYFHEFRKVPKEFGKIIEVWTDREV